MAWQTRAHRIRALRIATLHSLSGKQREIESEASVEPAYCDMAAHNLRVRREWYRERLRGAGFLFCDDHAQEPDLTMRQAQQTLAEPNTAPLQDLIHQGVGNSSCDNDHLQNIGAKVSALHCLCCSRRHCIRD